MSVKVGGVDPDVAQLALAFAAGQQQLSRPIRLATAQDQLQLGLTLHHLGGKPEAGRGHVLLALAVAAAAALHHPPLARACAATILRSGLTTVAAALQPEETGCGWEWGERGGAGGLRAA